MSQKEMTLSRFILEREKRNPETADLALLLMQLGLAAKTIVREVSRAGLTNITGLAGEVNVQGEEVKKLDRFANETFIRAFGYSGLVCTLISEEMEQPLHLPANCPQGRYTLLFDPIDGSSNTDVNGPLGTIFSFYEREEEKDHGTKASLLRKGSEQMAAGYILYGPSTILVYTSGNGVHGFTLDPGIGEFLLSHENIRIPPRGRTFSVNSGNYNRWQQETRHFINYLSEIDSRTDRPYSLRYVGSLTADFHRTLLEGGVYLYPGSKEKPGGKLRLLYEAAPLALVAEAAGGRAGTGIQRILDLQPETLHQRVPLIIGSPDDVALAEEFMRGRGKT